MRKRNFLSFVKAETYVFLHQLNSKNDGLVLFFMTIFSHWNCFLSSVGTDVKNGDRLTLESWANFFKFYGWACENQQLRIIIECFHSRGQHLCKFIGKKTSLHEKRVELPEDWFGTPFYCFGPKSYRPKGQPRSTKNEFRIRADFGNSRKHPIWRLKCGENWQLKVVIPSKRTAEEY